MKLLLKIISAASIITATIYMVTAIHFHSEEHAVVSMFAILVFGASIFLNSFTKEGQ